jgi:hypothetical protein
VAWSATAGASLLWPKPAISFLHCGDWNGEYTSSAGAMASRASFCAEVAPADNCLQVWNLYPNCNISNNLLVKGPPIHNSRKI